MALRQGPKVATPGLAVKATAGDPLFARHRDRFAALTMTLRHVIARSAATKRSRCGARRRGSASPGGAATAYSSQGSPGLPK